MPRPGIAQIPSTTNCECTRTGATAAHGLTPRLRAIPNHQVGEGFDFRDSPLPRATARDPRFFNRYVYV